VPLVVLGSTTALPNGYSAYLVNNTTQIAFAYENVSTAPIPLPVPNTTPSFANPAYQSSINPGDTFSAGSSISVYVDNVSGGCIVPQSIGSFTVQ
jgi:hypothetical protein